MNNILKQTISALNADILSPKYVSTYTAARYLYDVLASYSSISSVLDVLRDRSDETYPQREELIRVLVTEQQLNPSSFWSSVLIVVCAPMLIKLRHQIYGDIVTEDDLDQIIITSFLTAINECNPKDEAIQLVIWIKHRTKRRVFQALHNDLRKQHMEIPYPVDCFSKSDQQYWPAFGDECFEPQTPQDAAEAVLGLLKHSGNLLDAQCFDLVTAKLICRRSITEYVNKVASEFDDDTKFQMCQRLRRRYNRSILRLHMKNAS